MVPVAFYDDPFGVLFDVSPLPAYAEFHAAYGNQGHGLYCTVKGFRVYDYRDLRVKMTHAGAHAHV